MVILVKFAGLSSFVEQQQLPCYLQTLSQQMGGIYYTCNGRIVRDLQTLGSLAELQVSLPLNGGKGGFGAKLKTESGKKVRPNDNMYSRDIQGRPIAYAAIEKQYREYFEKKIVEDEKVSKQMAQFKVMENTLKEENAFMKLDRTYNAKMGETEERVSKAIKLGFQNYLEKMGNREEGQAKVLEPIVEGENEGDEEGREEEKKTEEKKAGIKKAEEEEEEKGSKGNSHQRYRPSDGLMAPDPQKKIRPDEAAPQMEAKNERTAVKMSSARDKLKNLFKK